MRGPPASARQISRRMDDGPSSRPAGRAEPRVPALHVKQKPQKMSPDRGTAEDSRRHLRPDFRRTSSAVGAQPETDGGLRQFEIDGMSTQLACSPGSVARASQLWVAETEQTSDERRWNRAWKW
jgi:hypothetical protein